MCCLVAIGLIVLGAKVSAEDVKRLFPEDNGTKVEKVETDKVQNDSVFDLSGRKVPLKSMKRGQVYIVAKRKIVRR